MPSVSKLELKNGLQMEIERWGDGDARPFVLVHGYTGSRDDWAEQLAALAALGPTVALDLRGHGGSSNSGDPADYTFDGLATDVELALDALEIERCDLLGHSMGGIVAQLLALRHPERIASLILMDTLTSGQGLLPDAVRAASHQIVATGGMQALVDVMENAARTGRVPQPPSMAACIERMGADRFHARIRAKLCAMDPVGFTTLGEAFTDWPGTRDRLGEIACPTTVIVGDEDAPFREPSKVLASGIPGAVLEVIPAAAHSPQLEHPEAWLAAVKSHLERARA